MADILQAAKSYEKLLDVEYQIVLGKKNKNTPLFIIFEEIHFFSPGRIAIIDCDSSPPEMILNFSIQVL